MTSISASTVKELRDKTGAGMMDCKAALTETGGDIEAAVDWLRTKGLAKAAKKAGRLASEGLVGLAGDGAQGALVELNSETDFVARNEQFQEAVRKIAELALIAGGDLKKLAAAKYPGTEGTVEDQIKELIATIGENMSLRRTAQLAVDKGVVASYLHNSVAPGVGKIGVLVALESEGDKEALTTFGKQLAMHVAATSPLAISADELDADVVERERAILTEQAKDSGKPDEVVQKMVEGRLRKYFEEVVLLSQTFVIDGESNVEQAVTAAESEIGAPIKIAAIRRIALGEGLDKREEDFAAEVAAAASGA